MSRIPKSSDALALCDPMYSHPNSQDIASNASTKLSLKRKFHGLYELKKIDENLESKKDTARIATLNVHYWTSLYDKACPDKLFDDIRRLNADVICLQEVSLDKTRYNPYDYKQLMSKFTEIGYIDYVEVYGSQYLGARYGNLILSKFPLSNKSWGQLLKGSVKVRRGYCCASITALNLDICCVHLDVFDETGETRNKQLQELLKLLDAPRKNLLICGDFNAIRESDYPSKLLENMKKHDQDRGAQTDVTTLKNMETINYHSCFDHINKPSPSCTVWSGRAIDFIFVPQDFTHKISNCDLYYTINTDHYGIYLDMTTNKSL